jgi:hypothetical protein
MPVMDVAFPRQGHGVSRDDNELEAIVEAVLREQNTTYYVGLTLEYIYKVTSGHEDKYIPA